MTDNPAGVIHIEEPRSDGNRLPLAALRLVNTALADGRFPTSDHLSLLLHYYSSAEIDALLAAAAPYISDQRPLMAAWQGCLRHVAQVRAGLEAEAAAFAAFQPPTALP